MAADRQTERCSAQWCATQVTTLQPPLASGGRLVPQRHVVGLALLGAASKHGAAAGVATGTQCALASPWRVCCRCPQGQDAWIWPNPTPAIDRIVCLGSSPCTHTACRSNVAVNWMYNRCTQCVRGTSHGLWLSATGAWLAPIGRCPGAALRQALVPHSMQKF